MTQEQVIALTCRKHVKIYKLKQIGLTKKEIAQLLGTNVGHVYNELKRYDLDESLKEVADSIG